MFDATNNGGSMAYYRTAKLEDIEELADNLRAEDRLEVFCSHGYGPKQALTYSFGTSKECNSIIDDGERVIGMFGFGVTPDNKSAIPWLLASDELSKIAKQFLPESKAWVDRVVEPYDYVFNYVHASNRKSIKWLKWLGFTLSGNAVIYGYYPAPFYKFTMVKEK